jgi:pyruvyl transferase EpsI
MNNSVKKLSYRVKSELRAFIFPTENSELNKYKYSKKIFVFLCAFYQNMGDMAITLGQEKFLKDNFPEREIILIPAYRTYHWMKQIKKITNKDDIITIIGGGNMSDSYWQLEDARRFVIKNFPGNKIVSFPQTIDFIDEKELKKTIKTYSRNKNLIVFARERNSFNKMQKLFTHVELCPDIALYLNDFKFDIQRCGAMLVFRNDNEKLLKEETSEIIKAALALKYKDISEDDTVNIPPEDCTPEHFRNTVEKFLLKIASKELVVTDRLHCMIFCAITHTPCIALDNSNGKISGIYNEWLKDFCFIRMCTPEDVVNTINEFNPINTEVPNISDKFINLKSSCI